MERFKLKAVLGSHPHVRAVKSGELHSKLFDLDFIEYTPTNTAFKPMVREQAFDVCEMAIVTYLMAKAHGKPLVLLPATMLGRFQHSYALYNPARASLGPSDLEGKRVGIRSELLRRELVPGARMADLGLCDRGEGDVLFEEGRDAGPLGVAPAEDELVVSEPEDRVNVEGHTKTREKYTASATCIFRG